jgi:hypothetical protein
VSQLFADTKPVFNLTYHSYGEYILAPLGCGDPSDMGAIMEIAQALNSVLENDQGQTGRYATGPGWNTIYTTDGTTDDEAYGRYGILSYCIEVNSTGFQPDYATWRNKTVERQRTAWQFFLDKTLDAASIRGRVTDALTGQPLAANLSVEEVPFVHGELQRTANPKGAYCWVTQANRTYHITFSLPGYVSQTHEVSVGTGPSLLDVQLAAADPGRIPHDPVPASGALNQPLGLALSWEGTTSEGFEVYFGLSSDPPKVATVTDTAWTTPALETGRTYYWKVAAVTAEGPVSGPVWSFSTYAYGITGVSKMGSPFRLRVSGTGFKDGCQILINGTPAPQTVYQGADRLEARKGSALKSMVPKGVPVEVTVRDASGNASPAFTYTR